MAMTSSSCRPIHRFFTNVRYGHQYGVQYRSIGCAPFGYISGSALASAGVESARAEGSESLEASSADWVVVSVLVLCVASVDAGVPSVDIVSVAGVCK